jgi:hypothetical protein
MAERKRNGDPPRSTTPERFADTIPPEIAPTHSFSVQAIFELQRSFGKIERAVENLEGKVDDHSKTLKSIERTIWIATGAFVIVSGAFGLALKYGLDMLVKLLAKY